MIRTAKNFELSATDLEKTNSNPITTSLSAHEKTKIFGYQTQTEPEHAGLSIRPTDGPEHFERLVGFIRVFKKMDKNGVIYISVGSELRLLL